MLYNFEICSFLILSSLIPLPKIEISNSLYKILFNQKRREDIKQEGYSFRSEENNVNEDVDDVIEILKTKWTK